MLFNGKYQIVNNLVISNEDTIESTLPISKVTANDFSPVVPIKYNTTEAIAPIEEISTMLNNESLNPSLNESGIFLPNEYSFLIFSKITT